jgi:hypothetical protein
MGSSVGMRDGHANVQSTPCVIRDDGSSADCGEYCEVAGVYPQVRRIFVIAGVIWCANHLAEKQSQTSKDIPTSSNLSSLTMNWMSK